MKRVGEVLSTIFDKDLMEKARGYSAMFSCWKDLAEKNGIPAAADHSWIKNLDRGLVWIEVDHPGWKQILQTKESKLLSDFRRRFPEMDISGIAIVLCRHGTAPASGETEAAAPEKYPLPPEPEPMPVENGCDTVREGALKDALMRLEQSVTAREKGNTPL
ncbi:MAG: DUF721 domain-containing protein [Treponema sp.]|jgi:hypothetical protein|nr:DUF721 domain-containing protein [Treponema sp.]